MTDDGTDDLNFGVVVIGRNEGERLKCCLISVTKYTNKLIYVDSDSTDDSVETAISMGVNVVELDVTIPFTAARARNEGFIRLCELFPHIAYVQFVDGDCEVVEGWFEKAVDFLDKNQGVAVACGRRRERYPDRTVYNMLCEPELCVRLRQHHWKVWRLDVEMTLHDAAIKNFGQWWKRAMRAGYAFGEGARLHGKLPEKHWVKSVRSAWFWGFLAPLITILLTYTFGLWALTLLLVYPLQILRITFNGENSFVVNFQRAFFLVLGKFPEILGILRYLVNRSLSKNNKLIEYK
jgi:glycosyltransferase involved in cell wall biosynthesis